MAFEDLWKLRAVGEIRGLRCPPNTASFYLAAMFHPPSGMSGLLIDQVGDAGGLTSNRTMPDGQQVSEFLRYGITRFANPAQRAQLKRTRRALAAQLRGPGVRDPNLRARLIADRSFDLGASEWMRRLPFSRGPFELPLVAWAACWPDATGQWVQVGNLFGGVEKLGRAATAGYGEVGRLLDEKIQPSKMDPELDDLKQLALTRGDVAAMNEIDRRKLAAGEFRGCYRNKTEARAASSNLDQRDREEGVPQPGHSDRTGETASALADLSITVEWATGELGEAEGMRAIITNLDDAGLTIDEARYIVLRRAGFDWKQIGDTTHCHWTTAKRRHGKAEDKLRGDT